jgi:hypothetical protein
MQSATERIMFSASAVQTFQDCEARFYHDQQRYPDPLTTDHVAADVSMAIHDSFMELHHQVEQAFRVGNLPDAAELQARVQRILDQQLRRRRLNVGSPKVAERLQKLGPGIERATQLVVADLPSWAVDPATGDPLVWAEAPLDHGPSIRAVELQPDYLLRTRPDVIGLRGSAAGICRVVVRDYKAKGEVVDPAYDTGILVRAVWAAVELAQPRCRWFLAGRAIQVDASAVELETVNLMHADGTDFLVHASLTVEQLLLERDRLVTLMGEMAVTLREDVRGVPASPGPLCAYYCPHLQRCQAGMAHVRKYRGVDVLEARLGAA